MVCHGMWLGMFFNTYLYINLEIALDFNFTHHDAMCSFICLYIILIFHYETLFKLLFIFFYNNIGLLMVFEVKSVKKVHRIYTSSFM